MPFFLVIVIVIVNYPTLECALCGDANPRRLERQSCSGWHRTMDQPLYKVSRKYHFMFSFNSVLCKWGEFFCDTRRIPAYILIRSGLATPGRSTKADLAPYDLRPHNLGLNTAWMRAQDRSKWRQLVETAMLTDRRATRWWGNNWP